MTRRRGHMKNDQTSKAPGTVHAVGALGSGHRRSRRAGPVPRPAGRQSELLRHPAEEPVQAGHQAAGQHDLRRVEVRRFSPAGQSPRRRGVRQPAVRVRRRRVLAGIAGVRPLLRLVRQRRHLGRPGRHQLHRLQRPGRGDRRPPSRIRRQPAVYAAQEVVHGPEHPAGPRDPLVARRARRPIRPNHVPVWGNVHNTHIQVDPTWFIKWLDLFKLGQVKLPPILAESIDLDQAVPASPKKALSVAELQHLYARQNVEPHRYALAELKKLINTPELTAVATHPFYLTEPGKLGFDLADTIGKLLQQTDGSVAYEELDCVGLAAVRHERRAGRHHPRQEGERLLRRAVHRRQPRVRDVLGRLQQQRHVRDLPRHRLGEGLRPGDAARGARVLGAAAGQPQSVSPAVHRGAAGGADPRDPVVERGPGVRQSQTGCRPGAIARRR